MTRVKVASAGLPGKDWFNLAEVAAKWTDDTGQMFTVDTLLHFGARDALRLGIMLADERATPGYVDVMRHGHKGSTKMWVVSHFPCELTGPFRVEFDRVAKVLTDGWCSIDTVFSDWIVDEIYPETDRSIEGYSLEKSREITQEHLVVTRSERDRFEKENRIGAHAGEMPKPDKIDGRERTTLLQMIRVMDRKLELEEAPKTAARELQEYAAALGFELRGKADTIAGKIREARNLED